MALKVGDLYWDMEVRGDVRRDLNQARDAARELETAGSEAHRRLQQIAMPSSFGSDARNAQNDLRRIGTEARDADRRTNDIRVNPRLQSEARQASSEVSKIAESASRAANKMGEMGQGLGERLSTAGSGAGSGFGGAFLAGAAPKLASLGSKAGPIGMAITGVLAIGVGAGAMLADAIGDGMNMQKAKAKVQAELGTTPEMMRTIAKAAADSYTDAFGESVSGNMEAAKFAIQGGLLNGEETAGEMKPVIDNLTMVSDLLGEDIPRVSRSASQMIKTGMAKDAAGAFDVLVKANQRGLNVSEDLLDTVDEYSTQFRKLGLDGEASMALMFQAVKNGARDTDTAADALKEFSIRAVDGSKASADAYALLGMDAEEMSGKIAMGGEAAADGLDMVLDGLRNIHDPVKREAAAVGLFGTKAEDLGAALYAMDLDKAAQEFGKVGGAAKEAARVMGDNAAAKVEKAQRSIEVSVNGMKESLAQAFGPALGDLADWVSTHKPEIIGFFAQLTDGILACAEGFTSFASGTLRTMAWWSEALADTIGVALDAIGGLASGVGGVIKHIPGLEGTGKALEGAGDMMGKYGDRMDANAATMRTFADNLDKGNEKIGEMRDQLREQSANAVASAEVTRALGDEIMGLPEGHDVYISQNTPEVQQKLKELDIKIENTKDGRFKMVAETEEGQARIDGFIAANTGREVGIQLRVNGVTGNYNYTPGSQEAIIAGFTEGYKQQGQGGRISRSGTYANGGITDAPDQATISPHVPGGVNQWAEEGPEAYVPLAPEKKARSTQILAQAAGRFGMWLVEPARFADGGIVDSLTALGAARAPGLQVTDTYRPGAADFHGAGQAVDFSNGSGNTDEMLAWANYLADNHREDILELIYDDPRFNKNIKNGQFVSRNFYAGAGDHTNHVHLATKKALSDLGDAAKMPSTMSPKQQRAKAIYDEGKRRGMSDKAIKIALATALTESGDDLTMWANSGDPESLKYEHDALGYDHDSVGLFQQRNNGAWGTTADRMDPTKSAGMFYDALSKVDYENMDSADAAQAVQRSAFSDGSNYRANLGDADALFNEVAGLGDYAYGDGGTSSGGSSVQDVRVTNWPPGVGVAGALAGAQSPAAGPTGAAGGVPLDAADGEPRMLETGELVIPKDVAQKYGPFFKAIGAGNLIGMKAGGIVGNEAGGFGGYSTAGAKGSIASGMGFGELLAFGVGMGFTAASGFDAEGRFRGFSTSSSEVAGLEKRLNDMWAKREEIKQVVVENMIVNANDPQALADGLFKIATTDPATLQTMERGL